MSFFLVFRCYCCGRQFFSTKRIFLLIVTIFSSKYRFLMIISTNATPFVFLDIQLRNSIFINSSFSLSAILQFLWQYHASVYAGREKKNEIKFIEIKTLTLLLELSPLAAIIISFELTANAILNQLKVHGLNTTFFSALFRSNTQ